MNEGSTHWENCYLEHQACAWAEIDKLRAELSQREQRDPLGRELLDAYNEIDRLRAELADLACPDCSGTRTTVARERARAEKADAELTAAHAEIAEQARLLSMSAEREARLRAELAEMSSRKDGAYFERNQCVALIARMAMSLGYWAGTARTAIEGWSDDWHGCVYIDLPAGQVSWHYHDSQTHLFEWLPPYCGDWDGHDTPEKYRRVLSRMSLPNISAEEAEAQLAEAQRVLNLLRVPVDDSCEYEGGLEASLYVSVDTLNELRAAIDRAREKTT